MAEIAVTFEPGFDPRPDWLKTIEDAISDAKKTGWNLTTQIVFEGEPYIWEGEPKMSTWSIDADPR